MLSFAIPAHETVVPVERIRELCQTTPPTTVYVHGRVTTVGRGILHDAQDMVADVYSEYPPGTRSTEFVLLPKPELGISPFACAGEVGAPIRLEDGSLVGFVRFRSYRTIQGGCQIYVTPAELVLKDIAESLQAKDVLFIPCWNEEAGADGSG